MSLLVWKALHLLFMVTWFSGLFYLPRLFVYHAMSNDEISIRRFKVMERKLYYGITWPGGVLTVICGLKMLHDIPAYFTLGWLQLKLILVGVLWIYHLVCGYFLRQFAQDENTKSHVFYRVFNEVPVFILIGTVFLAVLRPAWHVF